MNGSPYMHLAIMRDRHADMLREARKHELARRATEGRPGVFARLRARFGADGSRQPAPRAA
jgi:hypothetical protein